MRAMILGLLLACGGGAGAETASQAGSSVGNEVAGPPEPAAPVLVIAPLTMTDGGGQEVQLRADGSVVVEGAVVATLHDDGRVLRQGQLVAQLGRDGRVRLAGGEVVAQLHPDQSAEVAGRRLRFDTSGVLVGGNPDTPSITLAPADSEARAAALLALVLMTLPTEPDGTPPSSD